MFSAMRARLRGERSEIAAGTREIFRMWSRCSFSVTSKHSTWPSRAARGDDRDFALERHEGFEDRRLGRRARRHTASGSAPSRIMAWPLPS